MTRRFQHLQKRKLFATVLCHEQTVHNEYLFSAQEDSQVHLVQTFDMTAFYH